MSSIRRTLKSLKSLSEDQQATEGERQAALKAFKRLLRVHQLREQDLMEQAVTILTSDIRYKTPAQELLLISIGRCLGLQVYTLTTVRKLKRLRFEGDVEVLKLVPDLFEAHRDAFERKVAMYTAGLAYGMFPYETSGSGDGPEISDEEYEAMRSGAQQGKRVAVRPELQNVLGE